MNSARSGFVYIREPPRQLPLSPPGIRLPGIIAEDLACRSNSAVQRDLGVRGRARGERRAIFAEVRVGCARRFFTAAAGGRPLRAARAARPVRS